MIPLFNFFLIFNLRIRTHVIRPPAKAYYTIGIVNTNIRIPCIQIHYGFVSIRIYIYIEGKKKGCFLYSNHFQTILKSYGKRYFKYFALV